MSARKKSSRSAVVMLTQRALADLNGIERYSLETWGRKTAGKYLDDLAAALDRLKANPQLLCPEPSFAKGLYFYRVREHLLVCDYDGSSVIVLTVLHTRMDIPTRLAELQPRLFAEGEFLHNKLRGSDGPD